MKHKTNSTAAHMAAATDDDNLQKRESALERKCVPKQSCFHLSPISTQRGRPAKVPGAMYSISYVLLQRRPGPVLLSCTSSQAAGPLLIITVYRKRTVCSSVVQHLLSMLKVLGSVFSISRQRLLPEILLSRCQSVQKILCQMDHCSDKAAFCVPMCRRKGSFRSLSPKLLGLQM